MAKDPAFLFYSKDWLSGTQFMDMTERGIYITLLAAQHQNGHLDPKRVGFLLGISWDSVSDIIKSKFETDENGLIFNERLDQEIENRLNFLNKQKINGSKGGRPKKQNPDETQIITQTKPKKNPTGDVNENVIVITNENENENEKIVFPFDSENFQAQWNLWKEYKKKEHKFSFKSLQSEQASLNQLNTLANGQEQTAIQIIHQSLAQGWKGFFELKQNGNAKPINQNGRNYSTTPTPDEMAEWLNRKHGANLPTSYGMEGRSPN